MEEIAIRVFYVGEGDCIVLKFPDDTLGLVDSCVPPWKNATPALKYIRQQGGRLSFMCLTHPHLDHFGGMLAIAKDKGVEIDEFWHPFHASLYEIVKYKSYVWQYGKGRAFSDLASYEMRAEEFPRLMDWARDLPPAKERCIVAEKRMRSVDNLYEIVALAPSELATSLYVRRIRHAWAQESTVEARYENRVSAVLLIRFGDARIILGADAFAANWREILDSKAFDSEQDAAHCFKAAHHGSKYGFYRRMWPKLVRSDGHIVVSAGGLRLASTVFVQNAAQRHTLWCTGCGPFCKSGKGASRFAHLDCISEDEAGEPCFEDIDVLVSRTGDIEVRGSRQPQQHELKCRQCSYSIQSLIDASSAASSVSE